MEKNEEKHHFLFVNGLHRSGTSILYRVLSNQVGFSGFSGTGVPEDEGQHLQTVYKAAKHYGGPGKFGFDKKSYLKEDSKLVNENNKQQLFDEWSKHWDLNAEVLVEKSPPNIIRTRFLQAMFPNSSFITILRHPIATSYATKKWSKTSLNSLFQHWLVCHRQYLIDRDQLSGELMFKYEDFTNNPGEVLADIADLLNKPLSLPEEWEVRKGVNDKYFRRWEEYRNGFWTKRSAKKLIEKYEASFNEFGYSLIDY